MVVSKRKCDLPRIAAIAAGILAALILTGIPVAPALAGAIATSAGKLDTDWGLGLFLAAGSVGNTRGAVIAGGTVGGLGPPPDFTGAYLTAAPTTPPPPGVVIPTTLAPVVVTANKGAVKGAFQGVQMSLAPPAGGLPPKFPTSKDVTLTGGVTSGTTTSIVNAGWTSQTLVDPVFGVPLFDQVSLVSLANVTRTVATSPAGTAVARANDPAILTAPAQVTDFGLRLTLSDLELFAAADPGEVAFASLAVSGAFGSGSIPGTGVMFTFDVLKTVQAYGGGSDGLPYTELVVLDETFDLLPGEYWLEVDLLTTATVVPEPNVFWLWVAGLALVNWRRLKAVDGRQATRASTMNW